MGAAIEFDAVTVIRTRPDGERTRVLDRASFKLPADCRAAVIGPSGVGKSTLLRLTNRLEDPTSGRIFLDGADIRTIPPPELRRRVGMVFQQPRLFDASVRENLNRPLLLAQRPPLAQAEADAMLGQVDLPPAALESHSRELSLGQQQRVAIARALVLRPEVLLLDEPTSALDPRSAATILQLLVRLADALNMSILMVSHITAHATFIGQQVLALRDGEVRQFADLAEATAWAFPDHNLAATQGG